jgi:hypothetical protein
MPTTSGIGWRVPRRWTISDSSTFAVSTTIAAALVEVDPSGMREKSPKQGVGSSIEWREMIATH